MQCCLTCDYYAPWGSPMSDHGKIYKLDNPNCPICGNPYIWAIVKFNHSPVEHGSAVNGLRDKGVNLSVLRYTADKEFVKQHLISENDIQYWMNRK